MFLKKGYSGLEMVRYQVTVMGRESKKGFNFTFVIKEIFCAKIRGSILTTG
jgi:hypothetical protein